MELKTPLSIYWDLPAAASERHCDLPAICAEILALRVFNVHLLDAGATLSDNCRSILATLQGKPVAVTLTAPPAALVNPPVRQQLLDLGVKTLYAAVSSLEPLRDLAAAGWFRSAPAGLRQGISFAVDGSNCRELPGLLAFCRDCDVQDLVFPILRAGQGDPPACPGARERAVLARELPSTASPVDLRLTIHDPFLWKVFYPERPFPEGGCQAANTMLYFAPDGGVYPCPALPYRLGTLGATTLAEITASSAKTQLRRTLGTPPQECLACADLSQCHGGCRGRGYLAHASWNEADPACR